VVGTLRCGVRVSAEFSFGLIRSSSAYSGIRCPHERLRNPTAQSHRGVDLISDALPFGRLWYAEPNAVSNAIGYAKFRSRSCNAVIRVYDDAGNVIETHEHIGESICQFHRSQSKHLWSFVGKTGSTPGASNSFGDFANSLTSLRFLNE
jgi:hypothetical protein